jgi:hypothetical protein
MPVSEGLGSARTAVSGGAWPDDGAGTEMPLHALAAALGVVSAPSLPLLLVELRDELLPGGEADHAAVEARAGAGAIAPSRADA